VPRNALKSTAVPTFLQVAEAQGEKHPHIPARNIIDRLVLGGSDGAIEGVATTAALNAAGVGFGVILLAGFAFASAGGLSMFFSSYLSTRAELESLRIDVERERMEIETEPEEERRELEQLLKKEGYEQGEVDVIMNRLTKNKEMWLRAQLSHELHLYADGLSSAPVKRAVPAGVSFFVLGLLALLPYAVTMARLDALAASAALSLGALFVLGSKAFIPRNFSFKEGARSAAVGAIALCLLYAVGLLAGSL
jgi:VIT1/CCC1 family predicted Fe2+/Mn2+ transporter